LPDIYGPVQPGAGQQFHRTAVEPRMHAVAVIFDFVQPLIAIRRGIDQLRELGRDPLGSGVALGVRVADRAILRVVPGLWIHLL
jgi:hypothetical protein